MMEARVNDFVIQSREHLINLEHVLLSLEKPGEATDDRERIDGCLRLVHSLKGDAGFLGYAAIRTLANSMETLLESMRDRQVMASAAAIERLLAARDRLAALVDDLENSDGADLRETLAQLEAVEHSPLRPAQLWDIDLRQSDRRPSPGLMEFFSTFERCGVIAVSSIVMASHDLTRLSFPLRYRWMRSVANSGCRRQRWKLRRKIFFRCRSISRNGRDLASILWARCSPTLTASA
jgi:HPt (histidine-containing phosphotransfer) domain-containing protein